MCGIAGILHAAGAPVAREELERLSAALAHRGPDGEGIWISDSGSAGFVHRRLAILDTSARGAQPMHSADGAYTIVFNGEIFNFIELRDELRGLGCTFHSDSDTEVILAAWQHWEVESFDRLHGPEFGAFCDGARGLGADELPGVNVTGLLDTGRLTPIVAHAVGRELRRAHELWCGEPPRLWSQDLRTPVLPRSRSLLAAFSSGVDFRGQGAPSHFLP